MELAYNQFKYTPITGSVREDVYCGVCGKKTDVSYDQFLTTSFAGSIIGVKSNVDCYCCSDYNEDWHKQVYLLKKEILDTSSNVLAKMLEKEVQDILSSKNCTKIAGKLSV